MSESKIERVIRVIAERNHTTPEQVRREMQEAMEEGMNNPDPKVQAAWKKIPHKGEAVTLEEFLEYIASQI